MESEHKYLLDKLDKLSHDLHAILPLGIALSTEKDPDRLRERILIEAKSITHADAGLLYLRTEADQLRLAIRRSVPLHPEEIEETTFFPPSPLLSIYDEHGAPNYRNVATTTALCGYSVNIPNVYEAEEFDFSGTKAFDRKHNYRTISMLAIPLNDDDGKVIGIFELINARDPVTGEVVPFDSYHQMLEPGDLLMTFTDGVLDARDPAGQLFAEKRLLSLLQQPIPSALALLGDIEANLRAHIDTANQFDDITMLAARRLPLSEA